MSYLFHENPEGLRAGTMEFFSILLRVRIALGMPAYVLQQDGEVLGAMMGYDSSRPAWPISFTNEWRQLEATVPSLAARLAAYDAISGAYLPSDKHYYLGVIGVHPSLQGQGAGKAMLAAFASARAPTLTRTESIWRQLVRAACSFTTPTASNSEAKAASVTRIYGASTSSLSG
ncbi:MAG: GNAT family N-acetyltransferase [Devosia sp.]